MSDENSRPRRSPKTPEPEPDQVAQAPSFWTEAADLMADTEHVIDGAGFTQTKKVERDRTDRRAA